MVSFFGDYDTTETVVIPFNTFTSDDPSASSTITDLVAGDIEIHKDGSATQRSSDAGVTVTIDFDTVTGNHIVAIDLSDNTDAEFYAAGSRYQVRMEGTTVDGATINAWIGAFSIGCTLRPATDGRTLVVDADGLADANMVKAGPSGSGTAQTANDIGGDVNDILDDVTGIDGDAMRGTDSAYTGTPPTAADIVNEWETQSQADPTGFHVNVIEVGGTAQTANDNGADINEILTDTGTTIPGTITTIDNEIATIDSNVDAILLDTGTDGVVVGTNNDKTGYALTAVTGLGNQTSNITGDLSGSVGSVTGAVGSVTGQVTVATNNDKTGYALASGPLDAAGVRTAVGLAAANLDTQLAALPTDADVNAQCDSAISDAGLATAVDLATTDGKVDTINTNAARLTAARAGALTDLIDGGRLDLILDAVLAMLDNARTEPGQGAPPVNPDAMTKLDYLYKAWRNKTTSDADSIDVYNDAGDTVDHKATLSDDATTFTRGEMGTGA